MKIHVHTICWNEAVMLPYFLRHYQQFADKIVVHDNHSTDGSADIAGQAGAEVQLWDSGNQVRDDLYMKMKREIVQRERMQCDWLLIVDVDELILFTDARAQLADAQAQGYNAIEPAGQHLVSRETPTHEGQIYEHPAFQKAVPGGAKPCILRPAGTQSILFDPGGHSIRGHKIKKLNQPPGITFLHCKHIGGPDALIARYAAYSARLSRVNKQRQWGRHYLQSADAIRAEFEAMAAAAVPFREQSK